MKLTALVRRDWPLIVAVVLGASLSIVWGYPSIMGFTLSRRSQIGMVLDDVTQVATMDGQIVPGYSHDSTTFLAFLDAGCRKCRVDARAYVRLARWIENRGGAVRLQLKNSGHEASQFVRLAGDSRGFVLASEESFAKNGVVFVPTMLVVDRRGRILRRWAGELPSFEEAARSFSLVP